jgi:hypothetical protein
MNSMGVAFGKELREPDLEVWWNLLNELPIETFERAAVRHAKSGQHFPRPAEIFALAGRPSIPPPTLDDEAELACGVAVEAVCRYGRNQTVAFEDPAIHLAIQSLGGWPAWCNMPEGAFTRKSFTRAYVAAKKRIAACSGDLRAAEVPMRLTGEMGEPTARVVGEIVKVREWAAQLLPAAPGALVKRGGA